VEEKEDKPPQPETVSFGQALGQALGDNPEGSSIPFSLASLQTLSRDTLSSIIEALEAPQNPNGGLRGEGGMIREGGRRVEGGEGGPEQLLASIESFFESQGKDVPILPSLQATLSSLLAADEGKEGPVPTRAEGEEGRELGGGMVGTEGEEAFSLASFSSIFKPSPPHSPRKRSWEEEREREAQKRIQELEARKAEEEYFRSVFGNFLNFCGFDIAI
jgi:hypothetical protein